MRIVRALAFWSLWGIGCASDTGKPPGPGGATDGDGEGEPAFLIEVDTSATDRFVVGAATSWPVAGRATASLGLAGVEVAGEEVRVAEDGAFAVDVGLGPGLTVVPVFARDVAGHERKGHVSLLAPAEWRPEGELARDAARLVLREAILDALAEPLWAEAGAIDIAGEILARDVLSVDDRCVTWPVVARQGAPGVELALEGAQITLRVRVPDLYVYFEGECQGLLRTIPIAGEMATDVEITSRLAPRPAEGCVVGLTHTPPSVSLPSFWFDVWGTGGPLSGWMVELASSGKAREAHDQLRDELTRKADALLQAKLADRTIFDRRETRTLLGVPVEAHLCLTSLVDVDGTPVAGIGAATRALAEAGLAAPGAPQMGGEDTVPAPGELLLAADLVGQLLFSAWGAGGLRRENVAQADFALLGEIVPVLKQRHPKATTVDVAIDAELPPVATVSPESGADLRVDLGDLMLVLSVEGEIAFRLGARVTLDLALEPTGRALAPAVVKVGSQVHLVWGLVGTDRDVTTAIETVVGQKLEQAAPMLLGGATLGLPAIPGLGAPVDVTAEPGERFLRVRME